MQSKHPKRSPLDIGPEQGMQAIACREVNSHRKLLLQKLLDADKLNQGKLLGWIMINKQVQITCWFRFVAGRRTENKQCGCPHGPDRWGKPLELR